MTKTETVPETTADAVRVDGENFKLPIATGAGRPEDNNFNIGLFGDHGGGKTTWLEEILVAKKKRLLMFDTLCKDYGNPEFCKATGIKYDAVIDDESEFLRTVARLNGTNKNGSFRLVYRGTQESQLGVMTKLFTYDETKKRAIITDATWVIEETTFYQDTSNIAPVIKNHCAYGRHNRNNLIGVARIPKETNTLYRSQLNMIVSFSQWEKNALAFFADIDPDTAEELKTLERGHYRLFPNRPDKLLEFINKP